MQPPPTAGNPSGDPNAASVDPNAAGASAQGGFSMSTGGADADLAVDGADADPGEQDLERWQRLTALQIQNTIRGSTGLMRVRSAGSGVPGTFRLSLLAGFYSGGFLCNSQSPCPDPASGLPSSIEDGTSRIEADIGLSVTILPFLEAFAAVTNSATSNDRGNPSLLQVLGDTSLGAKAFWPSELDTIFTFGGEAELLLLNGTGGVGLDGSGTSFALRGLGSLDLNNRSKVEDRIPIRAHLNLGYLFDNSGAVVDELENTPPPAGRGSRISRVERFGLGINRVDSFEIGLGAEAVFEMVRPFLEWTIDIPVNRQGYVCNLDNAAAAGDFCLGEAAGFSTSPSRFTLGARVYPWAEHGLALTAALDVGTGATSDFMEEVAPELPWQFWLGVAYAVDTVPPKPITQTVEIERPADGMAETKRFAEGVVVNKKTQEPVADAIVRYTTHELTGMVTNSDGFFRTTNLEPGTYAFRVTAEGYKPGECTATLPAAVGAPGMPAGVGTADGMAPTDPAAPAPGEPQPAAPLPANPEDQTAMAGQPVVDAEPRAGAGEPIVATIRCELDELPKVGNIIGNLVDAASGAPVAGAAVKITDKLNRELELQADGAGAFQFRNVPEGVARITASAPGYMNNVREFQVEARKDLSVRIQLHKKPETPSVVVTTREIKLKRQIHFQHDSAEILPESMSILQEIAETLKEHPEIARIEVQGHTDNTGGARYNVMLSQQRAEAVVEALMRLGIAQRRLSAKGYGAERPLVPNVSDTNRARNRRVQIMILEKN